MNQITNHSKVWIDTIDRTVSLTIMKNGGNNTQWGSVTFNITTPRSMLSYNFRKMVFKAAVFLGTLFL